MGTTHYAVDDLGANAGAIIACIAGFACSLATLGVTYSIGVFITPLHREFGWNREQILTTQLIVTVIAVLASPIVGWICDRHGVRRLLIASQLGFGLSFFALASRPHSLVEFYSLYGVMALLAAGTLGIPFVKLLTSRFDRRRGLALGIAMTGSGLCGIVVPPYVAAILQHYGWRAAYAGLGLLPLLLALPLTIAFVHDLAPARPQGARSPAAAGAQPRVRGTAHDADLGIGGAVRGYRFWFMCVAFFICSGAITAFLTNLVPLLTERGFATTRAASFAASFGLAVIVGRVAVGALIDRYWAPLVGVALFAPAAAAIAALSLLPLSPGWTVGAISLAGLAAGAEVDLMGYLVSRYYDLRHFATVYAAIYMAFALGPGIVVPLLGRMRDLSGSYATGLSVIAAGVLLCGLLLLGLGRYPAAPETVFTRPQSGSASALPP
jgi:MFS family permease